MACEQVPLNRGDMKQVWMPEVCGANSAGDVWQAKQASNGKSVPYQGQQDLTMNNGNMFVQMQNQQNQNKLQQPGQAQQGQAQIIPMMLNQQQLAGMTGMQGKQVVVMDARRMQNCQLPANSWERQDSSESTNTCSSEGMSYIWVPVPVQVDFQQQEMCQAYQACQDMNQSQVLPEQRSKQPTGAQNRMQPDPLQDNQKDLSLSEHMLQELIQDTMTQQWQQQMQMSRNKLSDPGQQQQGQQHEMEQNYKMAADSEKVQQLEKLQKQLKMAENLRDILQIEQRKREDLQCSSQQDGWQQNGQSGEGCGMAMQAGGNWLPANQEVWQEQGQMQGVQLMMIAPWGQGDAMYHPGVVQPDSDRNYQQPVRPHQQSLPQPDRGSMQEQMQHNHMTDKPVKSDCQRNPGLMAASWGQSRDAPHNSSGKCVNYSQEIAQLQQQLHHLQGLQKRLAQANSPQNMDDGGRTRQGNGHYNARQLAEEHPRRGGKGNSRPSVMAGHGNLAAADTMKSQLQALQRENPEAVFIARRINKLGHNSADFLRAHFQRFGPVKGVYVSHSRVKSLRSRGDGKPPEFQWRLRAAALGFVVMKDAEATKQILAEGPEHLVNGVPVRVYTFYRRGSNEGEDEEDELTEFMAGVEAEEQDWVSMAQLTQYSAQELLTAMPERYED
mmetsp:Transcript_100088/g.178105  ORF Transcript_100088/g.178105 Transcript_100088/m.178105 type:complete len:666 (-) Transcript_100088:164-2161(-)|eukprot:CAMPEP_0197662548 /NCGR_PEP_ID=MMETSP1338-20131121/53871_1 /TAXON_ID=43686 ORGANISM="Pelagodinium beii, Strain RCC1491" /NCGR_SAMPLE_ID=MMETSP1338 /ASSEMBLY_ACC=CAM_ASM_000754 /LENGTH=665 /DNA_ID=CAMNT_0043240445 /DNA_START=145 /DNA_END=2142 /DNA_ORIENTATION=+